MSVRKLTQYRVRWEIDIDAKNENEAAKKALEVQRDPNSTALFFDVTSDVSGVYSDLQDWIGVDLIKRRIRQ